MKCPLSSLSRIAITAALASLLGMFCIGQSHAQPAFDRLKVSAALQGWAKKAKDFDRNRPTVMFTTSTMGCTPCCATAINHAINVLAKDSAEANILVVVATPIPREGLAIRKKFKTPNVAEDAEGVLDTLFGADMILPDMYIIGPDGTVRLRHHDLQHALIDTLRYQQHLGDHEAILTPIKTTTPKYLARLQEDDDHIISDLRSEHLDLKRGTLEFLETRQNTIYRYNLKSGALLKEIPADESLALRLRDPNSRQDFWEDFAAHQSAMVMYESIAHPANTDTSYVLAQLYTKYLMEIDSTKKTADATQPNDTSITFFKSQCILKMVGDSVVAVDSVPESPWLIVGGAAPLGPDLLTLCIWEGALRGDATPQSTKDSAYSFLILKNGTYRSMPALRITDIEKLTHISYRPRAFGPFCVTEAGDVFYVNQRNGIFIKGKKSGDDFAPVLLKVGGGLKQARSFSLTDTSRPGADLKAPPDERFYVGDISTNSRHVHLLVLDREESNLQIEVQAYDMEGRYVNSTRLHLDSDPVLSASVLGYDNTNLFMLLKQKKARWTVASILLKDVTR